MSCASTLAPTEPREFYPGFFFQNIIYSEGAAALSS